MTLLDFPDLNIIAYHAGWPNTEELIGLCGKHCNLYMSISGIIGWYERSPYRGYHAIGTALQWMPSEQIVMGFDLPLMICRELWTISAILICPRSPEELGLSAAEQSGQGKYSLASILRD